eukprot:TRINITY_DN4956_c0_g1_i2.p1 TRINITY_DN4956_c0_g1~~TRINITY_DN4956_c0_g1_i2.p1  ORF type:complete len:470 (+),score=97.97 TRINITY_DN4956_c0_g1_i2:138-1547(+)
MEGRPSRKRKTAHPPSVSASSSSSSTAALAPSRILGRRSAVAASSQPASVVATRRTRLAGLRNNGRQASRANAEDEEEDEEGQPTREAEEGSTRPLQYAPLYQNSFDSTGADSQCESLMSQSSFSQGTIEEAGFTLAGLSRSQSSSSQQQQQKLGPEHQEAFIVPLPSFESFSDRGGSRRDKGLRTFALKVCLKLEERQRASYAQVADDLVQDLSEESGNKPQEKNIRRRVYDALNVLIAIDVISKEGSNNKIIQWKGLPSNMCSDNQKMTETIEKINDVRQRIEAKKKHLGDLLVQKVAIANLISRNHGLHGASRGVSRPVVESPLHLGIRTPPGRNNHFRSPFRRSYSSSPYLHGFSSFLNDAPRTGLPSFSDVSFASFATQTGTDVLDLPFILMACPIKERMDCQIDDSLTHVDFLCSCPLKFYEYGDVVTKLGLNCVSVDQLHSIVSPDLSAYFPKDYILPGENE